MINKSFHNKTISGIEAVTILIMLFSLTTQYQSVFDHIAINRVIGALIAVLLVFLHFPKIRTRSLVCLILLIFCVFSALFSTDNLSAEMVDWIYVVTTVLLCETVSIRKNRDSFLRVLKKRKGLLKFLVNFASISMLAMLVFRIGYTTQWGETYFRGLCNGQHTMGSLCCMLLGMILLLSIIEEDNWFLYLLYSLIPLYALLQCGARVFIIPAGILLLSQVNLTIKRKSLRVAAYAVGTAIMVYFFSRSMMLSKFLFVFSGKAGSNAMESFTSGRSTFWLADLRYYLSGNLFELLFGRSFMDVYRVNLEQVYMNIWSHNDLIYLLVGGGLVGTVCYLYFCILPFREKRIPWVYRFLLMAYMFAPMLLNGFMLYQHLVYSFVFYYFALQIKYQADML